MIMLQREKSNMVLFKIVHSNLCHVKSSVIMLENVVETRCRIKQSVSLTQGSEKRSTGLWYTLLRPSLQTESKSGPICKQDMLPGVQTPTSS